MSLLCSVNNQYKFSSGRVMFEAVSWSSFLQQQLAVIYTTVKLMLKSLRNLSLLMYGVTVEYCITV